MTLALPDRTGAARMQLHFARALCERGHAVVLLHGPPTQRRGENSSLLADQRAFGVRTVQTEILRRPIPLVAERVLERAVGRADAVVAVNQRDRAAAMRTAKRLGAAGIICAQNQHVFHGCWPLPLLKQGYYQRSIRSLSRAICTSERVRHELVAMGVKPLLCPVVPNGIPISPEFLDRSARSGPLHFITVGRLDRQKGLDVLLDAWAQSGLGADHRLSIVGGLTGGAQAEASSRYAASLYVKAESSGVSDSVDFLGERDDVERLLDESDVYVHSARWEGPALPLAILEALDRALPVAMTDCSGRPAGFGDGTHGWVVKTGSVNELAGALRKLAAAGRPGLRAMGEQGRALVAANYSIERTTQRFVDEVEEAIACGR